MGVWGSDGGLNFSGDMGRGGDDISFRTLYNPVPDAWTEDLQVLTLIDGD